MVAVRCRSAASARRWNGRPHHATTGVVRARATHSQPSNPSAGIIPSAATGSREDGGDREPAPRSPRRSGCCHVRRAGGVAGALDLDNEIGDGDAPGVVGDRRERRRVVHGRVDAVEPVERPLDARRTARAAHTVDRELCPFQQRGIARQTYPGRVSGLAGYVPADLDLVRRRRHPLEPLSLFSLEAGEVEIAAHVPMLSDDLVRADHEIVCLEEAADVRVRQQPCVRGIATRSKRSRSRLRAGRRRRAGRPAGSPRRGRITRASSATTSSGRRT